MAHPFPRGPTIRLGSVFPQINMLCRRPEDWSSLNCFVSFRRCFRFETPLFRPVESRVGFELQSLGQ